MVSCENLLSDANVAEIFGGAITIPEKGGKTGSRKMYRSGGGIFSNPFKNDSEKIDFLNLLLKSYENGIPHPKHLSSSKLNHLRASSLSIGGFTGTNHVSTSNQPPSLLSTNKTSLSTTDLHHLNHSAVNMAPFSLPAGGHPTGHVLSAASFDASDDCYYLEPEWGSIVENADQLPARVKSQNEAIWELLHTEVFYIRRLKVINDIFVACLLNLQNECILNEVSDSASAVSGDRPVQAINESTRQTTKGTTAFLLTGH